MKIIMDFRKFDGVVGGVEQGAIQITRNISTTGGHVVLVCKQRNLDAVKRLFPIQDEITFVPLDIQSHAMSISNARIDSNFMQELAVKEKVDVIHFFYNWSFPFNKKVPSVLTLHDVIPFTFREAMGFWRNRFVYRPAISTACRLNNAIATVSEYSRQDIAKKVGTPLDKIFVIPNGLRNPESPDPSLISDVAKKFEAQNGCVLNVGGIHERKNIERLIESFAKLVKNNDYKGNLLITGSASGAPYQEKMRKLCDAAIETHAMQGRVNFTGFITEEELDILLEIADVFIYPSLYEGFGIPILESMMMGTPVITSNITAMPEVAGDAGILVDPYNSDEMAAEMAHVINDKDFREDLIRKGKERAKGYSWELTCKMYIELYEKVIAEHKS